MVDEEHTPTRSYREMIEDLASRASLVVIPKGLLVALMMEFGGMGAVGEWLVGLASRTGHPIALHVDGMTTFLSPPGWPQTRLDGWVAGHASELGEALGGIQGIYGPGDLDPDTLPGNP